MTPTEARKKHEDAVKTWHACYEAYQACGVAVEATKAYTELRKFAADVEKQAARLVDKANEEKLLAEDDLKQMGLQVVEA